MTSAKLDGKTLAVLRAMQEKIRWPERVQGIQRAEHQAYREDRRRERESDGQARH